MPNFVIGRTGVAQAVTVPIYVILTDTAGQPVSGATCVYTSPSGGTLTFTLNGLGVFQYPGLSTTTGVARVTATANGYTNGPWVSTRTVVAGQELRFDSWQPVPNKQAASTFIVD